MRTLLLIRVELYHVTSFWPWGPLGMGFGLLCEEDGQDGEGAQSRIKCRYFGSHLGGFATTGSEPVRNASKS